MAALVGRGLSGVSLVMSMSLSSACPALVSACSGDCLRVHLHSTPLRVRVTGMATEADTAAGVSWGLGTEDSHAVWQEGESPTLPVTP